MVNKIDEETVTKEISKVLDDLIASYEAMDIEASFKVFSTDQDFFMIGSDGLIYDHETFYTANKSYFDLCSAFSLTTYIRDIKVLSNDLALVSWHYKAIATLKAGPSGSLTGDASPTDRTGGKDVFDTAGATFLFQKKDNQWIVINYQESTLPPRRE